MAVASYGFNEGRHTLFHLIEAQEPGIFLAIREGCRNVGRLEQFRTGADGQNGLAMAVLVLHELQRMPQLREGRGRFTIRQHHGVEQH